jgi:uncharacterized protein YmfQ (DUF2313 family)
MSSELLLAHLKALLPDGALYSLDENEDLHKLFEGIAESFQEVKSFLESLAYIRDPNKTPFLDDLERDLGVATDFTLTEAARRQQASAATYNRVVNGGTAQNLEELLRNSGFDVFVHKNNPAVDPALFPGDLLLNVDVVTPFPAYLAQCGGPTTVCGNINACCGRFDTFKRTLLSFFLPTDPDAGPFIFFVGGAATRDPGTGALTAIAPAEVPLRRKNQFIKFILQVKPDETWAVLIVNYV